MRRPRTGSFRHRLMLEAPLRSADGGGGSIVAWVPVVELWASIEPVSGGERVLAEGIAGRISHEIGLRYREGVDPSMRFRLGTRVFEIDAVLDVDERRRTLRCFCREDLL